MLFPAIAKAGSKTGQAKLAKGRYGQERLPGIAVQARKQ